MKLLAVVMLALIAGSLAAGLLFLVRDRGTSDRTAWALTVRIGLSAVLFVLAIAGFLVRSRTG